MREKLGDFSSIVCFKAVITGVEDTLGPDGAAVVFTRAGKVRGETVAKELGLTGAKVPVEQLAAALNDALGANGTRLCGVSGAHQDGEKIIIDADETVCSAGEPDGSDRRCTFTFGAIWGALESVMDKRYSARQISFVPQGGAHDTFEFTPVA